MCVCVCVSSWKLVLGGSQSAGQTQKKKVAVWSFCGGLYQLPLRYSPNDKCHLHLIVSCQKVCGFKARFLFQSGRKSAMRMPIN